MKKFTIVLLAVLMLFVLVGCSKEPNTAEIVEIAEVFTPGYEDGKQYIFQFAHRVYRLSLSENSEDCWAWLSEPYVLDEGVSGVQNWYFKGTYAPGEMSDTYDCTFTEQYSSIKMEEGFSTEKYRLLLSLEYKAGQITKSEYDQMRTMLFDGQTVVIARKDKQLTLQAQRGGETSFLPLSVTYYLHGQFDKTYEYDGTTCIEKFTYSDHSSRAIQYDKDYKRLVCWDYQDEVLQIKTEYGENEEEKKQTRYDSQGRLWEITEYFDDGGKNFKSYTDGMLSSSTEYDPAENRLWIDTYEDEIRRRRKTYDEDQLIIEEFFDKQQRVTERYWYEGELCRKIEVFFPDHNKTYTYEAKIDGMTLNRSKVLIGNELSYAGTLFEHPADDINAKYVVATFEADGTVTFERQYTPDGKVKQQWEEVYFVIYDEQVGDVEKVFVGWKESFYNDKEECTEICIYDTTGQCVASKKLQNEGYSLDCGMFWHDERPYKYEFPWIESKVDSNGNTTSIRVYSTQGKLLFSKESEPGLSLEKHYDWSRKGNTWTAMLKVVDANGECVNTIWWIFEDGRLVSQKTEQNRGTTTCIEQIRYNEDGSVRFRVTADNGYSIYNILEQHNRYLVTYIKYQYNEHWATTYNAKGELTQAINYGDDRPDRIILFDVNGNVVVDYTASEDARRAEGNWKTGEHGIIGQTYYISEYDEAGNCIRRVEVP